MCVCVVALSVARSDAAGETLAEEGKKKKKPLARLRLSSNEF